MFGYNQPFAYPRGSFAVAVVPPSTDPDEGEQMSACFAIVWLPYILGALSQLLLQSTWDTVDPLDNALAQARAATLISLVATPTCAPAGDDLSPFWDDTDAADAEGSPVESVYSYLPEPEDWVIAGFLTASGVPGAALEYLTIARRFRLAFRAKDTGGIAKIFLDGVLYGEIDTYSAVEMVKEIDVFVP